MGPPDEGLIALGWSQDCGMNPVITSPFVDDLATVSSRPVALDNKIQVFYC